MEQLKKIGLTLLIMIGFLVVMYFGSAIIMAMANSKLLIFIWVIVSLKCFIKLINK